MRKEPYAVGSYVHVLNRGAKKLPITRDAGEQWRFLMLLRYLNSSTTPHNWQRDISDEHIKQNFLWPTDWRGREPLVKILAFCLMPNHFHLLLKEIVDGGISRFMQRLGTSMSNYFNLKHGESGSIFQGSFKSRTVNDDTYLQYLAPYIMTKNPFELYPGGFQRAAIDFNDAYRWAIEYPFCSLADYAGERHSPIIDKDILSDMSPAVFRNLSRQIIEGKAQEEMKPLLLE